MTDEELPEGWVIEIIMPGFRLLRSPGGSMATIDEKRRGFRLGYSVSGLFVGEKFGHRPKYNGRGWRQALVSSAIATLREIEGERS